MTNAAKELSHVLEGREIIAARITFTGGWDADVEWQTIIQKVSDGPNDIRRFWWLLEQINYDAGYGTQYLDGVVYCSDCVFIRHEYDGSESWRLVSTVIPDDLK